jgi:hypothetical protein
MKQDECKMCKAGATESDGIDAWPPCGDGRDSERAEPQPLAIVCLLKRLLLGKLRRLQAPIALGTGGAPY